MEHIEGMCEYCWREPATTEYVKPGNDGEVATSGIEHLCDDCAWLRSSQDVLGMTDSRFCVEGQFVLQTIFIDDQNILVIGNEESTRTHTERYSSPDEANAELRRIRNGLHAGLPLHEAIGIPYGALDDSMKGY